MRALIAILVVCTATLAAADKPAGPKPGSKAAVVEAQKHYKQGEAYLELARQNHDAKIYDDAIAEFEESYRLSMLPDVIYYIAQVYREKGDTERALDRYQHFLDLKSSGDLADAARLHVAELKVAKDKADAEARRKAEEEQRRKIEEEQRRQADAIAAAERARQDELRRQQDAERRAREEEERKRREEAERRQAELRRRQEAEQAARARWDSVRADKHRRRVKGYKLAGVGVGFLGTSLVLALVGNAQYGSVKNGGFATASGINGAITTGQILDGFAVGLAVPGLIFTAVGVPRILGNRDPGEYKVTPIAGAGAVGLALSGPLP